MNWALIGVCILGFVLRLVGLKFGLPELYHADEPIVVNHALAYGAGDFNPHFFQIPPLVSYCLFVIYGLYYVTGWIAGTFENSQAFVDLFLTDPTNFYTLGRLVLGVLTGTATIFALYRLTRRIVSKTAALWAASLLATCFLHVRDSHYIYTDIPLCLLLVLAMGACLNMLERGSVRDYAWAGAMVGLCTSIKYNGAFIGVSYLTAHAFRDISLQKKIFSPRFWIGGATCLIAFVLTNPFAVLDFSSFWESVARQSLAQGFTGWFHHLSYSLVGGMGGIALACALLGMGLALAPKYKKTWVVFPFVFAMYFAVVLCGQPHDRYVLPLLPFLCLFAALFIDWALPRVQTAMRRWAAIGFVAFLIVPMIIKSAYSDWLFLQPDSRTLAKEWIESHVPPGTKIALDHTFYVPKLLPTKEQLQEKYETAATKEASVGPKRMRLERLLVFVRPSEPRYNQFFLSDDEMTPQGYLFGEPLIPYDFDKLRELGVQVVITHRLGAWKSHFDFFAQVEQNTAEWFRFSPYRDEWRDFSIESSLPTRGGPMMRTGGPFLWPEMLARRSNGEHVTVYILE